MNKEEILEKITGEYDQFSQLLNSALNREDDLVVGGWQIKEIWVHIGAWEEVLLRFHIGGESFEEVIAMPGAKYHVTSFDDINQHIQDRFSTWDLEAIQNYAHEIHNKLMEKLASLPPETFQEPAASIAEIGLDPYPLYEYVAANTFDHYAEHAESIMVEGE